MDPANAISELLSSRRGRTTLQAGLPSHGQRRVRGLRREAVASLAGVSFEHCMRLERGTRSGVSDTVLGALARALEFDDAERAHRAAGLARVLLASWTTPGEARSGRAAGAARPGA